jgi:acid phosphatase type 7
MRRLRDIVLSAGRERAVVLLSGDLSYADGFYPRWDSFACMMEPLASAVPVMMAGGNHEIGDGEAWQSYRERYPMPYRASESVSPLWWSRDIGPVHVIALCSYAATSPSSLQYTWLDHDLKRVNRRVTPWLVVMMHAPWYNSNSGHVAEAELMRLHMERLLFEHRVDVVLSGHVHAYERIQPVLDGCLHPCAPLYLNLGDGGNYEGTYVPWRQPQPAWSVFRESSFGVGSFRIVNETHARYSWNRSACEGNDEPSHVNFNRTCESIVGPTADDSSFSAVESDATWIVRRWPRGPPATDGYSDSFADGFAQGAADCPAVPGQTCMVPRVPPPPSSPSAPMPPLPPTAPPSPLPPAASPGFNGWTVVGTGVGGVVLGASLASLALTTLLGPRFRKRLAEPMLPADVFSSAAPLGNAPLSDPARIMPDGRGVSAGALPATRL